MVHAAAVPAVIQKRSSIAGVAQIHPPVCTDLEPRTIPRRILRCRPLHISERNVEIRAERKYLHRELHAHKKLMLSPVHPRPEINPFRMTIENHILLQYGFHKTPPDVKHRAHRPVLRKLAGLCRIQRPEFLPVIALHIPVLILIRPVLISKNPVSGAVLRFFPAFRKSTADHLSARQTVIQPKKLSLFVHTNLVIIRAEGELPALRILPEIGDDSRLVGCFLFSCSQKSISLAGHIPEKIQPRILLRLLAERLALQLEGKLCRILSGKAAHVENSSPRQRLLRILTALCSAARPLQNRSKCRRVQLLVGFHDLRILAVRLLINLMNGRARQNIVKLIAKKEQPALVQLRLRIGKAVPCQKSQHREKFRLQHSDLCLPVIALCFRPGRIRSAVVFQIQLSVPFGKEPSVHSFLQLMEEFAQTALLHPRHSGDGMLHPSALLQHLPGRAAASVSEAVQRHKVCRQILLLIPLPRSHQLIRILTAVVGGFAVADSGMSLRRIVISGCHKLCQNRRSVETSPEEGVVREFVRIVPAHLGRHEVRKAKASHNLRKRSAVSEDIRKEQHLLLPRMQNLFKITGSVKKLSDHGFPGDQVAVGLKPHAALGLPAALLNFLPDLLKKVRCILANELVQFRRACRKPVLRIFLHQIQHRLIASNRFLPCLTDRPFPGNIDMGISDAVDRDRSLFSRIVIILAKGLVRQFDRISECRRAGIAQIQKAERVINGPLSRNFLRIPLCKKLTGIKQNLDIIVKLLHRRIRYNGLQIEMKALSRLIGIGIEGHLRRLPAAALLKQHILMIHVHGGRSPSVQKADDLRIVRIPDVHGPCSDKQIQRLPRNPRILRNLCAKPEMPVRTAPGLIRFEFAERKPVRTKTIGAAVIPVCNLNFGQLCSL